MLQEFLFCPLSDWQRVNFTGGSLAYENAIIKFACVVHMYVSLRVLFCTAEQEFDVSTEA